MNARLARGRWGYRISHAVIFARAFSAGEERIGQGGIRHTRNVYGLLQHGLVDEIFVAGLLTDLPAGDSELYSHPSLTQFKHELDALLSPKVKRSLPPCHRADSLPGPLNMTRLIIIMLIALVLEAMGVVYLSTGWKQIGEPKSITVSEVGRLVGRGITNRNILLGVLMETIFFVSLLVMLKVWDVSLIWPLTSLGFVLTTLAAKYIRHEDVNSMRWAGVFLIVAGAVLVGYSEKLKTVPSPGREPRAEISKE